ncbi:unnamed protein product [Lampetra planeri]
MRDKDEFKISRARSLFRGSGKSLSQENIMAQTASSNASESGGHSGGGKEEEVAVVVAAGVAVVAVVAVAAGVAVVAVAAGVVVVVVAGTTGRTAERVAGNRGDLFSAQCQMRLGTAKGSTGQCGAGHRAVRGIVGQCRSSAQGRAVKRGAVRGSTGQCRAAWGAVQGQCGAAKGSVGQRARLGCKAKRAGAWMVGGVRGGGEVASSPRADIFLRVILAVDPCCWRHGD